MLRAREKRSAVVRVGSEHGVAEVAEHQPLIASPEPPLLESRRGLHVRVITHPLADEARVVVELPPQRVFFFVEPGAQELPLFLGRLPRGRIGLTEAVRRHQIKRISHGILDSDEVPVCRISVIGSRIGRRRANPYAFHTPPSTAGPQSSKGLSVVGDTVPGLRRSHTNGAFFVKRGQQLSRMFWSCSLASELKNGFCSAR